MNHIQVTTCLHGLKETSRTNNMFTAFERFCLGHLQTFGVFGVNRFESFHHRCRSQWKANAYSQLGDSFCVLGRYIGFCGYEASWSQREKKWNMIYVYHGMRIIKRTLISKFVYFSLARVQFCWLNYQIIYLSLEVKTKKITRQFEIENDSIYYVRECVILWNSYHLICWFHDQPATERQYFENKQKIRSMVCCCADFSKNKKNTKDTENM